MEIVRIGAISPPETNRSQWARALISKALELDLPPAIAPIQSVVTFTATLPPAMATKLKSLAASRSMNVSQVAAGLIAAAAKILEDSPAVVDTTTAQQPMAGEHLVNSLLHGLLHKSAAGSIEGKIVFAEAATGTGKGRMIACLAAEAASKGDTVVISAPLAVTWQLLDDLAGIEETRKSGVTLSLGRPNFISPSRTLDWAEDNERHELAQWVREGGRPLSARAITASTSIGQPLCWLMEDALSLAEDLPISSLMLDRGDGEDCPAEIIYRSLRDNLSGAAIVICSHYMLASHIRQIQLRGLVSAEVDEAKTSLPLAIDTLIVDEAHLLESAFAAIYSHGLYLRPLARLVDKKIKIGRTALTKAISALDSHIRHLVRTRDKSQAQLSTSLDNLDDLKQHLTPLQAALESTPIKTLDNHTQATLRAAQRAVNDALSGYSSIRLELSPVRNYPQLISGRSYLDKALALLWDCVAGGVMVSATLFSDENRANLSRWKLAVPKERALYLPPVHPAWTFTPVTLHSMKVAIPPDDSDAWADQSATALIQITQRAEGGTLVLCTSHANIEILAKRLSPLGERLIVQSRTASASICAMQYRAKFRAGERPVWLGLGAAWTGINLADDEAETASEDFMLTDLVISRLPIGLNRTLTHERRVAIGGFGVISQEALWHFRQGIGRLVRREGQLRRHLWVLDSRLESKEPWVIPFRKILAKYPAV